MMWARDTSGECSDEDEGSNTITHSFTSYTMSRLEENSSYTITVTANNVAGSAASNPVTGITGEEGEKLTDMLWMDNKIKSSPVFQLHLPLPLLSVYLT